MKTTIFLWMFILSLILILFLNFPNPHTYTKTNLTVIGLGTREIIVDFPKTIWFGQQDKIKIQFLDLTEKQGLSLPHELQSQAENKNWQQLEVDLVINGGRIDPPGVFVTAIQPFQNINLTWNLLSQYPRDIKGTIWIYIKETTSEKDELNQRQLIFTQAINIKTRELFSLPYNILRWTPFFVLFFITLIFFMLDKFFLRKRILK